MSKDCNCKTKKNVEKLTNKVDIINRNTNKYKKTPLNKYIFLLLKLLLYSLGLILFTILLIPLIVVMIVKRNKVIKINPQKLFKFINGK